MARRTATLLVALAIVIGGSTLALLFGGGSIAPCFGLVGGSGVSQLHCARVTGVPPTVGWFLPAILASLALGLLVILPIRRSRWEIVAGSVGLAVGAVVYLAARPKALEGPGSDGTWLSLPLPVEPDTLIASAVAGALVGLATASVFGRTDVKPIASPR